MTSLSPLRVERDGAVTVLTLNRPDVLNAFDEPLTEALNASLADCAADAAIRAVVITGAGLGVAIACDIRVAASSAIFRPAWGRVGLVPDAGSAFFLPRLIGWGRALDMVLTGEGVAAEEALRMGLVTRVWPDAEFAARWRELAQTLARGATEAFALTKDGLNAAMTRGFAEFLDHEAELQDRAGRTHDYAEGVRAFSEKRPAKMEGH